MQIAQELVASWTRIDRALTPVLGARGVAALHSRSLHLASARHPWLAPLAMGAPDVMDLAALESTTTQQSPTAAADGGDALLQAFHDLLASLIGLPLAERLLHASAPDDTIEHSSQDAAQ